MTHHADAERAEFEYWYSSEGKQPEVLTKVGESTIYKDPYTGVAWQAWKSARRAPAVPVPSRRPTLEEIEEAVGYHSSGWDCVDPSELIDAIMNIAAAPQPPEAAPVELPEPVYTMRVRGRMHDYTPTLSAFDLADGEHALYTEQQVRQLLATAKVERKPLTDEAIRTLYGESDGHWQMVGPQVLCFARSIESVHGIQEQST